MCDYFIGTECDVVGIGPTALSKLRAIHAKNEDRLTDYGTALDSGQLPIAGSTLLRMEELHAVVLTI
ncbi:MAG: hypothetical protein HY308_17930 [Gammaproteobacteria bacterium]|nr:hypothetical protein [Gammaproteobacteria bacterium]